MELSSSQENGSHSIDKITHCTHGREPCNIDSNVSNASPMLQYENGCFDGFIGNGIVEKQHDENSSSKTTGSASVIIDLEEQDPIAQDPIAQDVPTIVDRGTRKINLIDESSIGFNVRNSNPKGRSTIPRTPFIPHELNFVNSNWVGRSHMNLPTNYDIQNYSMIPPPTLPAACPRMNEIYAYDATVENDPPMMALAPYPENFTVESFENANMFDNNYAEFQQLHKKSLQKLEKVVDTRRNLSNGYKINCMQQEYALFYEKQLRAIHRYFDEVERLVKRRREELTERLNDTRNGLKVSVGQCLNKLAKSEEALRNHIELSQEILAHPFGNELEMATATKSLKSCLNEDDTIVYKNPSVPETLVEFGYDWATKFNAETNAHFGFGGKVVLGQSSGYDRLRPTAMPPVRQMYQFTQPKEMKMNLYRRQTNYEYPRHVGNNNSNQYRFIDTRKSTSITRLPIDSLEYETHILNEEIWCECSRVDWKKVESGWTIDNVIVTYVTDPFDFYVAPKDCKEKLSKYLSELKNKPGWYRAVMDKLPIDDTTIYYVFDDDDQVRRVRRINDMNPDSTNDLSSLVHVLFIDEGKTDYVHRSKLHLSNLATLPPLAQRCYLSGCNPIETTKWDNKAIENFRRLTCDQIFSITFDDIRTCGAIYKVSLAFPQGLLSELFVEFGYAVKNVEKQQSKPVFKKMKYQFHDDYNVDEWIDVLVKHVVNPSRFAIQRNPSKRIDEKFEELAIKLTEYFSEKSNRDAAVVHDPPVGSAVAGRYTDKRWYRAEILQYKNGKYLVRYVDFGNVEMLPPNRILAIPEEYMRLDVGVAVCTLKNVRSVGKSWEKKTIDFFVSLIQKKVLKMVVRQKKPNNMFVVDLYSEFDEGSVSIAKTLIENGMAKGTGELASFKPIKKKVNDKKKNENESVARGSDELDMIVEETTSKTKTEPSIDIKTRTEPSTEIRKKTEPSSKSSSEIDEVEKMFDNINVTTDKDPSNGIKTYPVTVISCDRPSDLRFSFKREKDAHEKLAKDMTEFYSNEENLKNNIVEKVEESMKCAVLVKNDDSKQKWCRGVVLKINENNTEVEVKLSDVGDTITVNFEDIRKIEEKFTVTLNNTLQASFAEFDSDTDWSSDVKKILEEELKKYEEYYIEFRGNTSVNLWGKMVVCNGPLDPAIVEWTNINQKLLQKDQPKKCDPVVDCQPMLVESLMALDKEAGVLNPNDNVAEWLFTQVDDSAETETEILGSYYGGLNKYVEKSKVLDNDNERDVDSDSDQSGSISAAEEETDWPEPKPLEMTHFLGTLTYVDDECNFYVQTGQNNSVLSLIRRGLDTTHCNSHPSPEDIHWKPGEICVAWYHLDNGWYRGRVVKIDHKTGKVLVVYVDYGNEELVEPSKLRKKISFMHLPIQCHKIPIRSDCVSTSGDGKWPCSVLEYIHKTVVDKVCDIYLKREENENFDRMEKLIVPEGCDLFYILYELNYAICTSSTKENKSGRSKKKNKRQKPTRSNVDEKLSTLKTTTPNVRQPKNEDENLSSDSSISAIETMSIDTPNVINFAKLRQSEDNECVVSVYHVPEDLGPSLVEVTEILSAKEVVVNLISCDTDATVQEKRTMFLHVCEELQTEAVKQPLITPPFHGRLCCAKFDDGVWYRAYVLDLSINKKSMVSVYYFDYGNVSTVYSSELHKLKDSWCQVPAQGIVCTLDNVELPDNKSDLIKLGKKLSKILLNKELNATIRFEPSKKKYFVSLTDNDGTEPYRSLFAAFR